MPSVSIVHMLETPGALRRNSRRLRSGHQVGWLEASPSGENVSRVWSLPAAVMRETSKFEVCQRLADAVRDVASVRRPVRLRVVLGVGGQLPQVRPVVVDAEDVPGRCPRSRKLENAMRPLKTSACAAAGAARMVPAASAASARDLMATPLGFGEWNYSQRTGPVRRGCALRALARACARRARWSTRGRRSAGPGRGRPSCGCRRRAGARRRSARGPGCARRARRSCARPRGRRSRPPRRRR